MPKREVGSEARSLRYRARYWLSGYTSVGRKKVYKCY
jgi:hypothetical protein